MKLYEIRFNASEAAIDIYNLSQGEFIDKINYKNIKEISDELSSSIRNHISPNDLELLAKTIWPNREDWKGKTTEELKLQVYLFSQDLKYFTELPKERQEELVNACCDLSKSCAFYHSGFRKDLVA